MTATYRWDEVVRRLRDAAWFAEQEHDFQPLLKWISEAEATYHADTELNITPAAVGKAKDIKRDELAVEPEFQDEDIARDDIERETDERRVEKDRRDQITDARGGG